MYGWTGKILKVDLTAQTSSVIEPGEALYHKFIGGKGLAGHYLLSRITQSWKDAEMPLIFMSGPLNDTTAPASGRMTVAEIIFWRAFEFPKWISHTAIVTSGRASLRRLD